MEAWRSLGNLDIGLLRTFLAVIDCGGVVRAARHIGRSQPATSLQLKRLEEQAGYALFRKNGRRLEPTAEGERLTPLARQLVALHDRTLVALSGDVLSGRLSIGVLDDFAEHWLTRPLARFAQLHPQVALLVRSGRRALLQELFEAGELDLLLTLQEQAGPGAEDLGPVPIRWIGIESPPSGGNAIPLVMLDGECRFRDLALAALRKAGRDHRIIFACHALSTQWQAIRAGFGVSLRTPIGIRPPLRVLENNASLPALEMPPLRIQLYMRDTLERPGRSMAALLRESVAEELGTIAY